jgi:hypothetical protein
MSEALGETVPDWSKLHTYTEQPWKSFEELCYQIAFRLFSSKGELTRVDDAGGGDGVEFYLTQLNGQETGWQAKFYHPQPRLSPDRKRHITESLEKALTSHRRLKKWILCTPTALTPDEQDWFGRELRKTAGRVRLEHWDASKIDAMLTKPELAGIGLNFFGKLEFTPDWFRRQVGGQLRNVKDKYDPLLHTEGAADLAAHALLGDRLFLGDLTRIQQKCGQLFGDFFERASEARSASFDSRLQDHCTDALQHLSSLGRSLEQAKCYMSSINKLAQVGRVEDVKTTLILGVIEDIRSTVGKFYESAHALLDANRNLPALAETEQKKNEQFESSYRTLLEPLSTCMDELLDLLYGFLNLLRTYSSHTLHFLGDAGAGKTHLTCNLSAERIQNELPAVLLLARDFSGGTALKKKILELCDIPPLYSFEDFLSALDSYAFSRRTKAVLAIDALNESKTPEVWTNGLGDVESAIESRTRVALVTTCRTSYVEPIWNGERPKNSHTIGGFAPEKVEEATKRYFEHYKIVATLTSASLAFFRNPLYLKIFCESQNPERNHPITVHIGEQSFLGIFEDFLNAVNQRISQKLSKPPAAKFVQNRLLALANELWTTNSRSVLFDSAIKLLDDQSVDGVDWDNSVTKSLEDENLLIKRDWEAQSETQHYSFTYDLLGGYLIARAALRSNDQNDARALVRSGDFASRLLADDFRKLHPMWDDVLRCAAVLLPERFQLYLQTEVRGSRALNYGIRALFEMRPSNVREIDRRALGSVFNSANNRKLLLAMAGETALAVDHPLNWEFWSELLKRLTIAERDESWTEHVRGNADSILDLISKVERECRDAPILSGEKEKRLSLAAKYLSWLLVSTHRGIRDFATKSLYWYGRKFPRELFALTLASFEINDLYVRERLIAASYGVAMALHRAEQARTFGREIFPEYARELYKAIFARDAKYGTTHALIRDYAKHTLDLALLLDDGLLTTEQRQRMTPPYSQGGIRRLHKGKDKNDRKYRDGNSPLGMDFHNYTLGRLVPERANYDYKNPLFKKVESHVWWRIYDLGYSLEKFGEIDKEIARRRYFQSFRSADSGGIDRYGKKYAWIAFFELYGLFQDRGILTTNWKESDARPSDVDVEPSFPENPLPINPLDASFLEPTEVPAREWVEKGPTADVRHYLTVKKISGEKGPWVLLDGSLSNEDEGCDHRIVFHVAALIMRKGHAKRLVESKKNSITEGYWMPRSPETYYAFAGEIPWCESIPENEWTSLELLMAVRKRMETKAEVARRLKSPVLRVVFSGIEKPGWALVAGEREARSRVPQQINERVIEKFEVLLPTISMSWESYHTQTSEGQGPMLTKDLARYLSLWVDLPSTDFRDAEGRRATFTCDWGDSPYKNHGRFVYIRQDLVDRYLKINGFDCAWGLWGERDFPLKSYQLYERNAGNRPIRATFQDCWRYPLE